MKLEQKIRKAIAGANFIDAATALTLVLVDVALKEAGGDHRAVKRIFCEIAEGLNEEALH